MKIQNGHFWENSGNWQADLESRFQEDDNETEENLGKELRTINKCEPIWVIYHTKHSSIWNLNWLQKMMSVAFDVCFSKLFVVYKTLQRTCVLRNPQLKANKCFLFRLTSSVLTASQFWVTLNRILCGATKLENGFHLK